MVDNYVYKSCGQYIVTLELLADTKTNESRNNIKDKTYAKYRANKLRVVVIKHKMTGEEINEIKNTYYTPKTILYETGKIVDVSDYDENGENVCSTGIHYFKTREQAMYLELDMTSYNGICIDWHGNGQKAMECTYKDGKLNGRYETFYENGQKLMECMFKDGKKDDKCVEFCKNGQLSTECTYKDGKIDGIYIRWHGNGQKMIERTFKDGKNDGKYVHFYENVQKMIECMYKNGKFDGKYEFFYENGQKKIECTYKDGIIVGNYVNFHEMDRKN